MHVVVLGGGYGGVTLTRRLERVLPTNVELTLVDERETHLVQHLIHRTIRTPSLGERLSIPFDEILARATFRRARVTGLDRSRQTVSLADGTLEYDVLAVALGAQTAFYGLPGVEEHATPLKRLEDAARIRAEFETVAEHGGRVVVGGAGLSGVQAAGELAEMATDAPTEPAVVVLEQAPAVAPSFPESFQAAVAEELDERGVDVRTGATVERADADTVTLADGTLEYDQFVWTGGIRGPPLLDRSRQPVRGTLQLDDRVFALGDAARVVDNEGTAVPATAQSAVQQANTVATNIERLVSHLRNGGGFEPRLARYRHDSRGWVVSVGDGTVAQVGSSVLRGAPARALKTTIGGGYMGRIGAVESAVGYVRDSIRH
jgi:NADH dehydrogenase